MSTVEAGERYVASMCRGHQCSECGDALWPVLIHGEFTGGEFTGMPTADYLWGCRPCGRLVEDDE